MGCLCAGVFVAALDITIISTALPAIADHFHSAYAYTWIGGAYVLANTATVPSWGKLSDILGTKPLLLGAVAIFFIGSLICSVGESMPLFLFGRAVQGLGTAGLITLVNICVSDLFALRDRGLYFGLVSVVWALASGVGPVLGGGGVPITGLAYLLLWFTLKLDTPRTPIGDGLKAVDWAGCLFMIGSTVMLLLGLDFGGITRPWNSATVICLITFSIVSLALFMLSEWKLVKAAVLGLRDRPSSQEEQSVTGHRHIDSGYH
ncbi:MFS drug transporter [Aspergillus sp. HF37]|nr:MFS drug transporter [Aspergillus sp. HF37]